MTTIQHSLYGKITYDSETGVVTVQKGDLAERLTWLIKPRNAHLFEGYYPDKFYTSLRTSRPH
jgi:hypothetical protein